MLASHAATSTRASESPFLHLTPFLESSWVFFLCTCLRSIKIGLIAETLMETTLHLRLAVMAVGFALQAYAQVSMLLISMCGARSPGLCVYVQPVVHVSRALAREWQMRRWARCYCWFY
jgi:hypothetical protein